jgi:hypothetical protein
MEVIPHFLWNFITAQPLASPSPSSAGENNPPNAVSESRLPFSFDLHHSHSCADLARPAIMEIVP